MSPQAPPLDGSPSPRSFARRPSARGNAGGRGGSFSNRAGESFNNGVGGSFRLGSSSASGGGSLGGGKSGRGGGGGNKSGSGSGSGGGGARGGGGAANRRNLFQAQPSQDESQDESLAQVFLAPTPALRAFPPARSASPPHPLLPVAI